VKFVLKTVKMKEWLKYLISILLFTILVNYWLVYQVELSDRTTNIILICGPAILSLFFVFRMLNSRQVLHKIVIALAIVSIATFISLYFRKTINLIIDYISRDGEAGMFMALLLYFFTNLLLVYIFNKLLHPKGS